MTGMIGKINPLTRVGLRINPANTSPAEQARQSCQGKFRKHPSIMDREMSIGKQSLASNLRLPTRSSRLP